MSPPTTGASLAPLIHATSVDVHPTVLLSVVDHFTRINTRAASERRVVGMLLGNYIKQRDGGNVTLDINNCFAVPFDEDASNPDIWFLDTNYAEDMFLMQRKVFPKARVVGWYSSGPTIQNNDMLLHTLIADQFCPNPIYCVVNTDNKKSGVPVLAYTAAEGREGANQLVFRNIPTQLGSVEPEEIGVEQLLRDLTDSTVTTLSSKISARQLSLSHLECLMGSIEEYLKDVAAGTLPVCQDILAVVQDLLSYQPQVHRLKSSSSMVMSLNDEALSTFIAAISRCVMALYGVVLNRRHVAKEVVQLRKDKEKEEAKAEAQKKIEEEKNNGNKDTVSKEE